MKLSIIVKKISMLIALAFVMGASAQSALAQGLVRFSGGIGDITTVQQILPCEVSSRWPDLGDPRPFSRREAGREHPG